MQILNIAVLIVIAVMAVYPLWVIDLPIMIKAAIWALVTGLVATVTGAVFQRWLLKQIEIGDAPMCVYTGCTETGDNEIVYYFDVGIAHGLEAYHACDWHLDEVKGVLNYLSRRPAGKFIEHYN